MSHYIHSIPGRLRVRAPQLRGASCKADQLCAALARLEGVQDHQFNPKAGSILVLYDPGELTAQEILYQMHKADCLPDSLLPTAATAGHPVSNRLGTALGNALFGTLIKKGLETSVASFAKALV